MADENTRVDQARTVDATLPPHTLLLHTYEVEQRLASGGMGEVYLARNTELGTRHAVKVIKPELAEHSGTLNVLELFRREATILHEIHHDAVVRYEAFVRDEKKHCYLVMEYVDGPSLSQVLKQRALSSDAIYVLRDRVASGLAAAHAKGVIHRDISPDNVILPEGKIENAKLIDFGIAKLSDPSAGTVIGHAFAGKLRYVAPEQLGLFGGQVGPYSDIYSLGLVLAAATGRPLDMGDSYVTAIQVRQAVPDLSRVPAELQPQLTAMLQPKPADRPQSISELLQRWPHLLARTSSPAAERRNAGGWLAQYKRFLFAALGVVTLVVIGFIFIWSVPTIRDRQGPKHLMEPTVPATDTAVPATELEKIAALSPDKIYDYARQYYDHGQFDEALVLWQESAKQNYGPAALALGELYDPVLWGKIPSPFSQYNYTQAKKWYTRASNLGVTEAAARLEKLEAWKREQPASDSQQ